MQLKSFGCSFIFGSDLADDGFRTNRPTASQLTWPAHLARHFKMDYQCYARPGAGNLQILEQVLNQATSNEPAVFVIGWTWIDRFDYYDSAWTGRSSLSPWRTIMPIDTDALAKTYYRDLHSEYRDKFTSLCAIKTAVDTLEQKGIRYIMTYMDRLLFDQRWHTTPAVLDLQKYVTPRMTEFEGKTFLEWSRENKFPESPTWHPLEPAHRSAADYMITVFDKQNKDDPAQQVLS